MPGLLTALRDRRTNKRRRTDEDTEVDSVFKRQAFAVKSARRKLLRSLTHGRTETGKKLFTSLLFVLERIWSFSTPEEAGQNGYEVVFFSCENDEGVPTLGPKMSPDSP